MVHGTLRDTHLSASQLLEFEALPIECVFKRNFIKITFDVKEASLLPHILGPDSSLASTIHYQPNKTSAFVSAFFNFEPCFYYSDHTSPGLAVAWLTAQT